MFSFPPTGLRLCDWSLPWSYRTLGNEDVSEWLLVNEPSCSQVTICLSVLLKCVSDPLRGTEFIEARKNHCLYCTCETSFTKLNDCVLLTNKPFEYSSVLRTTEHQEACQVLLVCGPKSCQFSMCVDLAILRVVMEDVALGASWPEESWFNQHH